MSKLVVRLSVLETPQAFPLWVRPLAMLASGTVQRPGELGCGGVDLFLSPTSSIAPPEWWSHRGRRVLVYPGPAEAWIPEDIGRLAERPEVAGILCDLLPDEFPDDFWAAMAPMLRGKWSWMPLWVPPREMTAGPAARARFLVVHDSRRSSEGMSEGTLYSASLRHPEQLIPLLSVALDEEVGSFDLKTVDETGDAPLLAAAVRLADAVVVLLDEPLVIATMRAWAGRDSVCFLTERNEPAGLRWAAQGADSPPLAIDLDSRESGPVRACVAPMLRIARRMSASPSSIDQPLRGCVETASNDQIVEWARATIDDERTFSNSIARALLEPSTLGDGGVLSSVSGLKWKTSFRLALEATATGDEFLGSSLRHSEAERFAAVRAFVLNEGPADGGWLVVFERLHALFPEWISWCGRSLGDVPASVASEGRSRIAHGLFRGVAHGYGFGWREAVVAQALEFASGLPSNSRVAAAALSERAAMLASLGLFEKAAIVLAGEGIAAAPAAECGLHALISRSGTPDGVRERSDAIPCLRRWLESDVGRGLDTPGTIHTLVLLETLARNPSGAAEAAERSRHCHRNPMADLALAAIHAWFWRDEETARSCLASERVNAGWPALQKAYAAIAQALVGDPEESVRMFHQLGTHADTLFLGASGPSFRWQAMAAALRSLGDEAQAEAFSIAGRELHPFGELRAPRVSSAPVRLSPAGLPRFKSPEIERSFLEPLRVAVRAKFSGAISS